MAGAEARHGSRHDRKATGLVSSAERGEKPVGKATPTLRALAAALAEIADQISIPLPAGCELRVVTAAQAALLDFIGQNPYCTIEELQIHAGDPDLVRLRFCEGAIRKFKLPDDIRPAPMR